MKKAETADEGGGGEEEEEEEGGESLILQLKQDIEEMSKENQVKILGILYADAATKLNSNKSGVFVNMTMLSAGVVRELAKMTKHIKTQEREFVQFELQKKELQIHYFTPKQFGGGRGGGGDDDDDEEAAGAVGASLSLG